MYIGKVSTTFYITSLNVGVALQFVVTALPYHSMSKLHCLVYSSMHGHLKHNSIKC